MNTFKKSISVITLIITLGASVVTSQPSNAESTDMNQKQEMSMRKKAEKGNIVATAAGNEILSTLVSLIKTAGLVDALSGKGPFTVFAPTNRAFDYLVMTPSDPVMVEAKIASLVANPTALAEILKYHVIVGNYPASKLKNNMKLTTLNGQQLTVKLYTNGKIKLVTSSGSPVATVTTGDVKTKNGTVHLIDQVLLPSGGMPKPDDTPKPPMSSAPETLSTLYKVLEQSGLAGAFESGKKYTVLAPDNRAFAKLSSNPNDEAMVERDMAALVANKDGLLKVLKNHVFDGVVRFEQLQDGQILYNILGDAIKVNKQGNDNIQFVDMTSGKASTLTTRNIETAFGIVHIVSEVILP